MVSKRPKLQPTEVFVFCCLFSLIMVLLGALLGQWFLLLAIPGAIFGAWLGSRL